MEERRKIPVLANGCAKSVPEHGRKRKGSPLSAGRNRVFGLRLVNAGIKRGKRHSLVSPSTHTHRVLLYYPYMAGIYWVRMGCGQGMGDGAVVWPLR